MVLYSQSSRSQPSPLTSESGFASRRKLLSNYSWVFILVCMVTTSTLARTQEKPSAAPPGLLSALRSKDKGDRRDAANQLGVLRARGAVRALVEALSDKEASVREASAFALGQISDPAATALLIPLLADPEPSVRASAIFALGLMRDEGAVDELIEALDDPSFDVRYDAVWALGQIGEPDAEEQLRGSLVTLDLLRIDNSQREAFRQAVQFSLEILRTEAHARATEAGGRPRRATGIVRDNRYTKPPTRPLGIHKSVRPAITDVALRAKAGGSVKLRVLVGADGKAVRVYVARRLGYGLDRRAVETALQYRYDPELEGGLPQTTWTDMEVKF